MYTAWTAHLQDQDEKTKLEQRLKNNKDLFERLSKMLDDRKKSLEISEQRWTDFQDANWAYKQAFRNGFVAALEISKLYCDLEDHKEQTNDRPATRPV